MYYYFHLNKLFVFKGKITENSTYSIDFLHFGIIVYLFVDIKLRKTGKRVLNYGIWDYSNGVGWLQLDCLRLHHGQSTQTKY
jgi:hypothetical protein